jgi:hypothetical protein
LDEGVPGGVDGLDTLVDRHLPELGFGQWVAFPGQTAGRRAD